MTHVTRRARRAAQRRAALRMRAHADHTSSPFRTWTVVVGDLDEPARVVRLEADEYEALGAWERMCATCPGVRVWLRAGAGVRAETVRVRR